MYSVRILEPDIHIHSPDSSERKLLSCELTKTLNSADKLSFTMSIISEGYKHLHEKTTFIEVIDEKKDEIVFSGRVIQIKESMNSKGEFQKEVVCESTINYLLDTHTREEEFKKRTIESIIENLLQKHNEKVDERRKIYKGNIQVEGTRTFMTSFESTLEAIKKYVVMRGQLLIRKQGDKNYLDYLQDYQKNICEINLGDNLIEIQKENDELFSRIIPVGEDNLRITNINNGKDYLQDNTILQEVYEKVVEYPSIDNHEELKAQAEKDLSKYTRPNFSFSIDAVDLSYLKDKEKFYLNSKVKIKNIIMGVDAEAKVISITTDLLKPYNPKLTISTKEQRKKNIVSKIVETNKNVRHNYSKIKNLNIGKKELQSEITQTNEKIELKAKELLDGIETNSASISITAREIRSEVKASEKTLDDKIKSNSSTISQTAESIGLRVDSTVNDINSLVGRMNLAEVKITSQAIVSTVKESWDFKKLQGDISSNESKISQSAASIRSEVKASEKVLDDKIKSNTSSINQTAASIGLRVDSVVNDINSLEGRMNSAEVKITPQAIVSTVKESTDFKELQSDISSNESRISQSASEIRSEVNSVKNSLNNKISSNSSKITQNSNSITSEVSKLNDNLKKESSRITQTADKINIVVDSYNSIRGEKVVAAINLSRDKIKMSAVDIELDGYVKFRDLKNSSETEINGDYIKSGTIDANKVTVKNLRAESITGGTLDFSKVTARNINIEDDLHIGDKLYLNSSNSNRKGIYLADSKHITCGTNDVMKISSSSGVRIDTGYNSCDIDIIAGDNITFKCESYSGMVKFKDCDVDFREANSIYGLKVDGVKNQNDSSELIKFKESYNNLYFKCGSYGSWIRIQNF